MKRKYDEYFFRGKDIENGQWIFGGFWATFYGNSLYIVNKFKEFREVKPETVGQFTGLFDKHHRKIFEDDIVRISNHSEYGIVIYDVPSCAYFLKAKRLPQLYIGSFKAESRFTDIDYMIKDFEVVGNIHDNSVMLEGENGP